MVNTSYSLGLSELGPFDGNSFGAGVFYYLPVLDGFDSAIRGSYHRASLDTSFFDDRDFNVFAAAFLVSPQTPLNDNGLNWYANAGLTIIIGDQADFFDNRFISDNSTEPQIGAGIYVPLGPGTLYAGADIIDEFIIDAGYRFGIQLST